MLLASERALLYKMADPETSRVMEKRLREGLRLLLIFFFLIWEILENLCILREIIQQRREG